MHQAQSLLHACTVSCVSFAIHAPAALVGRQVALIRHMLSAHPAYHCAACTVCQLLQAMWHSVLHGYSGACCAPPANMGGTAVHVCSPADLKAVALKRWLHQAGAPNMICLMLFCSGQQLLYASMACTASDAGLPTAMPGTWKGGAAGLDTCAVVGVFSNKKLVVRSMITYVLASSRSSA